MCGIAGQISFKSYPKRESIEEIIKGINHRGPDANGLWISENRNCVLGHVRLSIIDLSELGSQPMIDPVTGNCIVFNGEIYNFRELRKECELIGESFKSQSDTEVILVLYRLYGINFLQKLRGMFSFAIWDELGKKIFLARDRVGKKPLNYSITENGLIFCSEIEPLSKHPDISREKDYKALELYLQQQYIPAPYSIYKEIRKLKPAHYAIYDQSGFKVECYWNVDYTKKIKISENEALEEFELQLKESIRLRMISDVPLGALLSGGVDSSIIVALMAKLSDKKIRTFSIGFGNEVFNELPFAQEVSDIVGTIHKPEIIYGNIESLLPKITKHYGEPYGDSSAVPSFMVAKFAREHVTVAMNGDGGDELLGGYSRYGLSSFQMNFTSCFGDIIPSGFAADLANKLSGRRRSLSVKLIRSILKDYLRPELESLLMYDNFFHDRLRSQLLGDKKNTSLLPDWRRNLFINANSYANNAIDRMLWYDNRSYLPDDLLVKMDIASMHCGLEARSPLLDHKLIEYCASLPVQLKCKNGVTKYLLKKLAEKYFSKEFVYRKKMGFGIPLSEWLRGPLKELVEDTLSSSKLIYPLNPQIVNKILFDFMSGEDAYKDRVWLLLMYGLWNEQSNL